MGDIRPLRWDHMKELNEQHIQAQIKDVVGIKTDKYEVGTCKACGHILIKFGQRGRVQHPALYLRDYAGNPVEMHCPELIELDETDIYTGEVPRDMFVSHHYKDRDW